VEAVTVDVMPPRRDGAAEIVYVLCLLQAAFLLLGGVGEVLLMGGNPAYLVMPLAKMVLLFVFAAKALAGRRWALIAVIVLQGITLTGFWLQVGAGILPWVDFTVNLVGLITGLALPAATIYLCGSLYLRTPRPPRPAPRPAPQHQAPLHPTQILYPTVPAPQLVPAPQPEPVVWR
jgi:hypothetical protein